MKLLKIILLFCGLIINISYGFKFDEPMGGIAVSLGGVVLDKNMAGFNIIYNPNMIALNLNKPISLDVSVTYVPSPYQIKGIDNAVAGAVYGMDLGFLKVGAGLGYQANIRQAGISENRIYLGGSAFLPTRQFFNFLEFDGVSAALNLKALLYTTDIDMSGVTGFNKTPMAFDADFDVTLSFLNKSLFVGFMVSDILQSPISFISGSSSVPSQRGLILHGRMNLVKDFDLFACYNFGGSQHIVNRNNFLASSTAMANSYFGVEAGFGDSLKVRVGVNEGRLCGGIGLEVQDLVVNVGLLPIAGLNLYYQVDVSYRFFSTPEKIQTTPVATNVIPAATNVIKTTATNKVNPAATNTTKIITIPAATNTTKIITIPAATNTIKTTATNKATTSTNASTTGSKTPETTTTTTIKDKKDTTKEKGKDETKKDGDATIKEKEK